MLNKAQLLAKLAELSSKEKKVEDGIKREMLFVPQEGENTIRILPLEDSPGFPFKELYFHYPMNKTVLSPVSYGEEDPIVEFKNSLLTKRVSKEEFKAAMQFEPQKRTYALVLVRGKENEGPKWWSFGKTVFEQLLTAMTDESAGEITSPTQGRDIRVIFTPKEKTAKKLYPETKISISFAQTPITNDASLMKSLLQNQPNLLDVYPKKTYEELVQILRNWVNPPNPLQDSAPSQPSAQSGWSASPAKETQAEGWESPSLEKAQRDTSAVNETDKVDFDKLFETFGK